MKTYRFELMVNTELREQFLNLSYEVEECVRRSHVCDGICVVCSQHTTSAVFLENDREGLYEDWTNLLNRLVPGESSYTVDYTPAGAAHMKQMLLGSSVTVPVSDGRLDLGQHQFIMYGDFDGCRDKTVLVKIIGE